MQRKPLDHMDRLKKDVKLILDKRGLFSTSLKKTDIKNKYYLF